MLVTKYFYSKNNIHKTLELVTWCDGLKFVLYIAGTYVVCFFHIKFYFRKAHKASIIYCVFRLVIMLGPFNYTARMCAIKIFFLYFFNYIFNLPIQFESFVRSMKDKAMKMFSLLGTGSWTKEFPLIFIPVETSMTINQ